MLSVPAVIPHTRTQRLRTERNTKYIHGLHIQKGTAGGQYGLQYVTTKFLHYIVSIFKNCIQKGTAGGQYGRQYVTTKSLHYIVSFLKVHSKAIYLQKDDKDYSLDFIRQVLITSIFNKMRFGPVPPLLLPRFRLLGLLCSACVGVPPVRRSFWARPSRKPRSLPGCTAPEACGGLCCSRARSGVRGVSTLTVCLGTALSERKAWLGDLTEFRPVGERVCGNVLELQSSIECYISVRMLECSATVLSLTST